MCVEVAAAVRWRPGAWIEAMPGDSDPMSLLAKYSVILCGLKQEVSLPLPGVLVSCGCLNQLTTTWLAYSYRNVFSPSSGGWISEIKVWAGPHSLRRFRGGSSLTSFRFWWPQVLWGAWPRRSNPGLCPHRAFSCVCVFSSLLSLKRILAVGFRTYPGNLG